MREINSKLYKQLDKLSLWDKSISLKRNEYLKVGGSIEKQIKWPILKKIVSKMKSSFSTVFRWASW